MLVEEYLEMGVLVLIVWSWQFKTQDIEKNAKHSYL
jgi:hypothetical protein